ncbi:MAG: DNA repair protein RecN [Clostridia bacterium]|nr:DNA repair protein RecN [Clostridia bacterium]
MLVTLQIKDFGLIEEGELNFGAGLNVLTGETGAGKSVILAAILTVLGGRASGDMVRSGSAKARITAVFQGVNQLAADWELEPEEDGSLILTREINRSGRNTCRINGQLFPLSQYRLYAGQLVEVQGQHEQQALLNPDYQLQLLDSLSDNQEVKKQLRQLTHLWQQKKQRWEKWQNQTEQLLRQADFWSFQIAEITKAQIKPGEWAELQSEGQKLANSNSIKQLLGEAYADLQGENGVLELLAKAQKNWERLLVLAPDLDGEAEVLNNCLYQLEDLSRNWADYLANLEADPLRLEVIENRLFELELLFKKYGGSEEQVLLYQQELQEKLDEWQSKEPKEANWQQELKQLAANWQEQAELLSQQRRQAAQFLEKAIAAQLQELGMGKTLFQVEFSPLEAMQPEGLEKANFLVALNTGEPLKALQKTASGGELSRILLAVKTVLAELDGVPTLLFDEVDAGIGGRSLQTTARKLKELSRSRQLICVTHGAAVAALAEVHYLVYKEESQQRTLTRISPLAGEALVQELARMLGGSQTEIALKHARQLLQDSQQEGEFR